MANQRAAKHGRILRTLGISGTALALAACGGGGGGGGSDSGSGISGSTSYTSGTSPAAIDSEGTGTTAAAAAADSVSSSAGTSNLGVSAGSLGSALVAEGGEAGLSLAAAGLAARQLATEAMNRSGNLPAGVTESCNDGGSFSYTGSNSLSVGTPLVLAFDDCYFGSLGFDGSISLTLNAGDFSGNNYDATLEFNHFLIASSGQTVYGANGPIRIRSGSETQVFPTGHDVNAVGLPGTFADLQISIGAGGTPLEMVDNVNNQQFRMSDANAFYRDGSGGDGSFSTASSWYMAVHGNPMEMCSSDLNGCVTIDHGGTSAFAFNGSSGYPTAGEWQVDGSGSSYVALNASTGSDGTVFLTVVDSGGTTLVSNKEVDWTSLSSRDFASSLN